MMPGMMDREQESKRAAAGVLPRRRSEVTDRAGIHNEGYLDKKGTPSGLDALLNKLPPGQDIARQENADINKQKFYRFEGYQKGYSGDDFHSGYVVEDEV
jgi:hypothetical protein